MLLLTMDITYVYGNTEELYGQWHEKRIISVQCPYVAGGSWVYQDMAYKWELMLLG